MAFQNAAEREMDSLEKTISPEGCFRIRGAGRRKAAYRWMIRGNHEFVCPDGRETGLRQKP